MFAHSDKGIVRPCDGTKPTNIADGVTRFVLATAVHASVRIGNRFGNRFQDRKPCGATAIVLALAVLHVTVANGTIHNVKYLHLLEFRISGREFGHLTGKFLAGTMTSIVQGPEVAPVARSDWHC